MVNITSPTAPAQTHHTTRLLHFYCRTVLPLFELSWPLDDPVLKEGKSYLSLELVICNKNRKASLSYRNGAWQSHGQYALDNFILLPERAVLWPSLSPKRMTLSSEFRVQMALSAASTGGQVFSQETTVTGVSFAPGKMLSKVPWVYQFATLPIEST